MIAKDLTTRTTPPQRRRIFKLVLIICWFAVFFDGLDTFMYGATLSSMKADAVFGMTAAQAGNIGSLATFGMLVGALTAGTLTDLIGRRWGVILCCALFSIASAGCALASTASIFGFWRVVAGLGLGGLLPTAIAIVSEYSTDSRRNLTIGILMTGHQAGGIIAPLLGLMMIPGWGWRSLYWVGVLPLFIIVPLVLLFLPESLAFLTAKGRHKEAGELAEKLGFEGSLRGRNEKQAKGTLLSNIAQLFKGRNAIITPLFWVGSFGGLLLVYGMSTWLPSLMQSLGYNLGNSLLLLGIINAGGIIGMLIAGTVSDRLGPLRVSMLWFFITAVGILAMGIHVNIAVTYVIVFFTGIFLFSAQTMIYAAVVHVFPAETRGTALGWTTGIGRFGAVFGPWMGGQLFALGFEGWGFAAFASFAISSMIMLLLIQIVVRSNRRIKDNSEPIAAPALP